MTHSEWTRRQRIAAFWIAKMRAILTHSAVRCPVCSGRGTDGDYENCTSCDGCGWLAPRQMRLPL